MKTIKLYGHLGKQFGKIHKYHVENVSEAISLLSANYKDFSKALLSHEAGYRVVVGKDDLSHLDLHNSTSNKESIKIIPVVSGQGGFGKIIIGAALMVFAPQFAPMIMEGAIAAGATGATAGIGVFAQAAMMIGSAMSSFGMSMILGGVSELLYSPPSSSQTAAKQAVSGSFDGAINTMRQGVPIAVGYGELIVGSAVISAGMSTVQVPV